MQNIINVHKDFSDLLLLISLLDSQNIPRDLLNLYKDPVIVDDFIYHLKKYSLASSGSSELALSIHRSTQAILLAHITKLLDLKQNKNLIYPIEKVFQTYAEHALEKEDFQKMVFFVLHAETFLTHEQFLSEAIKGFIKGYLGSIYAHIGEYTKAERLLNESFSSLNRSGNTDDVRKAYFLAYLGVVYRNLGSNKKAIQSLEQSLAIFKKYSLENDVHYARTLAHLGHFHGLLGNYQKALSFLENSLSIYQKNLPADDIKIGAAFVFLGNLHTDLGHYEKAIRLLEKGHRIYRLNLPKDHLGIGWILGYLGTPYTRQETMKKRSIPLRKALGFVRRTSPKHTHG